MLLQDRTSKRFDNVLIPNRIKTIQTEPGSTVPETKLCFTPNQHLSAIENVNTCISSFMVKYDYYFIQHKNGWAGLATGTHSTEAEKQVVFLGLQKQKIRMYIYK